MQTRIPCVIMRGGTSRGPFFLQSDLPEDPQTRDQVLLAQPIVDPKPNCGNMLIAVGPFAIEAGLVPPKDPETTVRIYNVNTKTLVEALGRTPGGKGDYAGHASIDGG